MQADLSKLGVRVDEMEERLDGEVERLDGEVTRLDGRLAGHSIELEAQARELAHFRDILGVSAHDHLSDAAATAAMLTSAVSEPVLAAMTPPLRTALRPLQPAAAQARTPRGTKVPCPPAPLRVQCPPTPPLPGSPLIPRRLPIAMELEAEMAQLADSVDRLSGGIASGLRLSAAALLQLKCVMEFKVE